jgi:hypothetical protein
MAGQVITAHSRPPRRLMYHGAMNVLALPARVGVLVVLVALAGCQSEPAPRSASTPAQPPVEALRPQPASPRVPAAPEPPVRGYDGPLPALEIPPYVPNPAVVRAVYEFAARRPDVLHYVPCFCGCERNGHADNADCFVAGREADGRPRWELHGMG